MKYYYAGGSAYDEGVSIKDAGTYYVVLEGLGKYAGQKVTSETITVNPFNLVSADVTVDATTTSTAPKHPTKVYDKASKTELDPSLVDIVYTGTTPYGTSNTAYTFKAVAADGVNPATGKKTAAGADLNVSGEKDNITVSKVAAIATFGYDEGAWQDEFTTDNSAKKPVRFDVSKIQVFDADGEEVAKGDSNCKYDVAVYAKQPDGTWGTQAGTSVPATAGTYKVVVTVNAANNSYELGGSAECVVTVTDGEANADASVYVTYGTPAKVVTSVEKTFDGQAITADSFNVTAVKAKDSAANVQITKKLVDAKGKDVSTSGAINAGEYTLVITSSNYNLTGTTEIPVTVKAVDLTDLKLGDFVAAVPAVTDKDGNVTTSAVPEVPGIAEHNGYTYIVKPAADAGSAVSAYTFLYNTGKVDEDTGKAIFENVDGIAGKAANIDVVWEKYNTKKAKWETVTAVKDEGTYRVGLKFKGAEANAVNYTFADDDATYVEYEVVDQAKFKFDDVQPSDWFFNTVYEANKAGYVFGIGNSKQFGPNLSITRADVAVIIARMAGVPTDPSAEGYESFLGGYTTPFSDVQSGAYYAKAVAWAAKTGIVTGYGDTGEFKPDQAITREEFATMLARYAEKVKGADITADESVLADYADAANVSDWAKGYVAWAVEAKAMGQNTDVLSAGLDISRAEAATMAVRYQPAK